MWASGLRRSDLIVARRYLRRNGAGSGRALVGAVLYYGRLLTGASMTRQLGIFGYPLRHSISPVFQQAALDYHGLAARYNAWPTPPDRLADEVDRLRQERYLGANVTIPHKEAVASLVDACDGWAGLVGAVNTIVKSGDQLVGHNTDSYGLLQSLKAVAGFEPRGAKVLLLGAGGAARSAAFGLADAGVASLTIANRTPERARSLAAQLRGSSGNVEAFALGAPDLAEVTLGADLIVNATSVGMRHGGGEGASPLSSEIIPRGALVYDMVYTPSETALMRAATKAGARAVGGLSMLVYQGAASFELWTGKSPPTDVMLRAAETALGDAR